MSLVLTNKGGFPKSVFSTFLLWHPRDFYTPKQCTILVLLIGGEMCLSFFSESGNKGFCEKWRREEPSG
jgi:hypothetical protein